MPRPSPGIDRSLPEGPRIELLYVDGCPSHEPAGEALRGAFTEEGIEAEAYSVAVNTDEEARSLRFPGSPTIRVGGEDLFPSDGAHGPHDWGLRCRAYATPEGLEGYPTAGMLHEALRLALPAGGRPPADEKPPPS